MNFEVNGETYFLQLAEDTPRWTLFQSTEDGARRIPVYEDVPEFKGFVVIPDDSKKHRIPN